MNTQYAIDQAIDAMESMTIEQKRMLVTVVMAIVDNRQSDIATLHQNAPTELVAPLAEVLNSMSLPKSSTVDCSQMTIEPSLEDAMAIIDLAANAPDENVLDPRSKKTALLLAYEILDKMGVK